MYLISQLSLMCGVPVHTIRYYEKFGLLKAKRKSRGSNNYRYYDDEAMERLQMIEEGKSIGMSLTELKELMKAWYNERLAISKRIEALEKQIANLDEKELRLRDVRERLQILVGEMKKFT